MPATKLDDFTAAYVECALWASNDDRDPKTGGEPIDDSFSIDDVDENTLEKMAADCRRFQEENAELLALAYDLYPRREWSPEAQAGHDFWLTRNGHGAGFWDRGIGDVGDKLSDSASKFGESHLWIDGTFDPETEEWSEGSTVRLM